MSALGGALRALPLTFALYVVEAVFALMLSLPIGTELSSDARVLGAQPIFRAGALEHLLQLLPALRMQARSMALTTLLLLLLSPLLQMAWLSALSGTHGVRRALSEGTRLYLRACAVSLAVALALLACLAPVALGAYLVDLLVDSERHARLHDLLLVACAATALPMLWTGHVAHDLARACALRRPAVVSARHGLSRALSPRTQLVALVLWLLGLALGWAPLLLAARTDLTKLVGVALLQAGCLAALAMRSVWLAHALTCAERQPTSRVTGD